MAFIAPALSVLTGVMSAVGGVVAASSQASAASYNAKVAERNAKIAKQNSLVEEAAKRRETQRLIGAGAAAVGSSGLQMVGTPLDVLAENARIGELDALTIRYNGENTAESYRMDAQRERMAARSARTAGAIGAVGRLIGSVSPALRVD